MGNGPVTTPAGNGASGLPAVLAIDGGNSKTALALVAADGSLLAVAGGDGTKGVGDLPGSLRLVGGLTERAQAQAGLTGRPAAAHMSACMANADLPDEEEALTAALAAEGWTRSTKVFNDTFAVLRAGLTGGGWGVGVTCGAGINCVGLAPDGRTTRFLSLGPISGDWGGGYELGGQALWWAVRDEDGRGPRTALREAVAAHFGVPTVRDVTIAIHRGELRRGDIRKLTPVLFQVAEKGDEVARAVVSKQADEVATMALTAMRRLDLTGLATPVALGGGVLAARDPLLIAGIETRLAGEAPAAAIHIVDVPPVVGAALLGLDHIGAEPAAEQRLRAAYAGPQPVPASGAAPGQPARGA
ncbi:MAG TPA: BadF/BadG/BcrA/BcrD ATPase family protein [Streptosporangiaceae bacterium]|jgi:N-acetylglucosamine kinase-like BadF-type ATPase